MIHIVYHKNCYDGFSAAWVAHRFFAGEAVRYYPINHGDSPPPVKPGDKIFVLDITFKLPQLRELETVLGEGNVIVIDHHANAMGDLSSFSNAVFDNKKSGCSLAWEYFYSDLPKPEFIRYVEDRDLWNHKLPYTKEVCAYIYSHPFSFEQWDEFYEKWSFYEAKEIGIYLLMQHKKQEDSILSNPILIGEVPFFNTNGDFGSDVCNKACNEMKVPFSLYFYYDAKRTKFGIRGDGSIDVSSIARIFGGNGHYSAAGFELPGHIDPIKLGLVNFEITSDPLRWDWASPPGSTIVDIMDEMDLYVSGLCQRLSMGRGEVYRLLQGSLPITPEIAVNLSLNLRGTIFFWLLRQRHYDLQKKNAK